MSKSTYNSGAGGTAVPHWPLYVYKSLAKWQELVRKDCDCIYPIAERITCCALCHCATESFLTCTERPPPCLPHCLGSFSQLSLPLQPHEQKQSKVIFTNVVSSCTAFGEIRESQLCNCANNNFLRFDIVVRGINLPTFQRNLLSPS
jgi:hypothetical protein